MSFLKLIKIYTVGCKAKIFFKKRILMMKKVIFHNMAKEQLL
jgi:hypothetical protein